MTKIPNIKPGDLVKVYVKIKEGEKERVTPFQGVVIQTRGTNISKTFTVRKVSAGIGIERIFPINSPMVSKIEIKKKGKVRRAKLNYLKKQKGRRMKIKEIATPVEKKTKPTEEETAKEPAEKQVTPVKQNIDQPEDKTGESTTGQETVANA